MLISFGVKRLGVVLGLFRIARISAIPVGTGGWSIGDVPYRDQDSPGRGGYDDLWHHFEPSASTVTHPVGGFQELLAPGASLDALYETLDAVSGAPQGGSDHPFSHALSADAGDTRVHTPQAPTSIPLPQGNRLLSLTSGRSSPLPATVASTGSNSELNWFDEGYGPAHGVNEFRLQRARYAFDNERGEWMRWVRSLESIMPGSRLHISPVEVKNYYQDRVFIAHDGQPVHGAYPPLTLDEQVSHYSESPHLFAKDMPGVVDTVPFISKTASTSRLYVYLNSRTLMDYINREYFLGHAQFLPIKREALTRHNLNRLIMARRMQMMLPSPAIGGLPLVVLRHGNSGRLLSPQLQALVGTKSPINLMSLWSPVLSDGKRYTSVLYGIVSFDGRYSYDVLDHLSALSERMAGSQFASLYVLPTAASMPH